MDSTQPTNMGSILHSILSKGILPASKLEDAKTSYDEKVNDNVSLNCILTVDGIASSLYDQPANSSFAVATEKCIARQPNGMFATHLKN